MTIEYRKKCLIASGVIAGILLLFTAGYVGMTIGENSMKTMKDEEFVSVLEKVREDHAQAVVTNNTQVTSLQEALAGKDVELATAADLILKLKDKPAEVKYITRIKTVIEPAEPKLIYVKFSDLPEEHLFELELPDGKLVVAKAEFTDKNSDGVKDTASFKTFKETFILDAAFGEKSSSFLLRVKSSYDDNFLEVPVEAKVTYITEAATKVIQPSLSMHVGGYAGANLLSKAPAVGYQAGISVPWLHPLPSLDFLSPEIGIGQVFLDAQLLESFSFRGGINVISYNIGASDKSFLNDTWIGGDVSIGTDGSLAGGLTVGTRL